MCKSRHGSRAGSYARSSTKHEMKKLPRKSDQLSTSAAISASAYSKYGGEITKLRILFYESALS